MPYNSKLDEIRYQYNSRLIQIRHQLTSRLDQIWYQYAAVWTRLGAGIPVD